MNTRYLLIGSGRVSRHYQAYFIQLGLNFRVWTRHEPRFDLVALAQQATHIIVLISDPLITTFIEENKNLFERKTVVHASGVVTTPRAYGAHPLMTFSSDRTYEREVYQSIPFAIEGTKPFAEIMPGLPNKSFVVEPELKTLYHTLCVLSGNFTVALWQKAFSDFQSRLGVSSEMLLPYLKQVVSNLETNPEAALTGPVARKDLSTINKHIQQLEGDNFQEVYKSFVRAADMDV
jgi:2-dehydropantoate 2-reductase